MTITVSEETRRRVQKMIEGVSRGFIDDSEIDFEDEEERAEMMREAQEEAEQRRAAARRRSAAYRARLRAAKAANAGITSADEAQSAG